MEKEKTKDGRVYLQVSSPAVEVLDTRGGGVWISSEASTDVVSQVKFPATSFSVLLGH